jgi:hypothetical protein
MGSELEQAFTQRVVEENRDEYWCEACADKEILGANRPGRG